MYYLQRKYGIERVNIETKSRNGNHEASDGAYHGSTSNDILNKVSVWNQISKDELLEMLKEI